MIKTERQQGRVDIFNRNYEKAKMQHRLFLLLNLNFADPSVQVLKYLLYAKLIISGNSVAAPYRALMPTRYMLCKLLPLL